MQLSQLDSFLPKELIAQKPVSPRDRSKLLVLNRNTGEIQQKCFFEIEDYLSPNDVLVMNNTKVFPARIFAKNSKGKQIELLLVKEIKNGTWEAMRRGKVKVDELLKFAGVKFKILENRGENVLVGFPITTEELFAKLYRYGITPLPPYIKPTKNEHEIRKLYQTVYAKQVGSVAAPTAGFHFTEKLIRTLKQKGIQIEYVTLQVGLGTFLPIKATDLGKHTMHSESFEVHHNTLKRLNQAKAQGKRIIATGTTTTRVLETLADDSHKLKIENFSGSTNLFIYPPYKFKFVDALITNFHLPKSTLLALVSAFVSNPNSTDKFRNLAESTVGKAYIEAINRNYRFYSFGDAMFIY